MKMSKKKNSVIRTQRTFEIKYEFVSSKDVELRLQRAYELIFRRNMLTANGLGG